jgi:hypothetical protein
MILSSTSVLLESLWRVLLFTYHGALNTILSVFDCILCMICVFEGLAQPHSCIQQDKMGLMIAWYRSSLFSVVNLDFLTISHFILRSLRLIWVFFAVMCDLHVSFWSIIRPRYFTPARISGTKFSKTYFLLSFQHTFPAMCVLTPGWHDPLSAVVMLSSLDSFQ